MRVLFLLICLSIACTHYPSAGCRCPFGIGKDLPGYIHEEPCPFVFAVLSYRDCICKYIYTPEAERRNEKERYDCMVKKNGQFVDERGQINCVFGHHDPMYATMDDLMINPDYDTTVIRPNLPNSADPSKAA